MKQKFKLLVQHWVQKIRLLLNFVVEKNLRAPGGAHKSRSPPRIQKTVIYSRTQARYHAYIDSCATPEAPISTTLTDSEEVAGLDHPIPTATLSASELPANAVLEVFPNPFTTKLNIRFHMQEAGQATMDLFDLHGRLVRQLHHGPLDEGLHWRQWDGTDESGHQLLPGMYFIQLRTGDEVLNRKVLLQGG